MRTRGWNRENVFALMLVTAIIVCLLPLPVLAATWYVRTDGGDITQCNGQVDAPYPGTGIGQNCAVNHLFWLFPPPAKTPLISGGDTVVIGPGQYMMGINAIGDQAPNTSACQGGNATFTCMMAAIPSGPDINHPTTIIGKNWDTKASAPPELWGAGRTDHILNLTGSNNVVLQYLDITDHAQCGYNFTANPSLMCNRTVAPYGYQADYGIYATDSANVLLKDVNLHGLASGALHAGRLTDWTFDSVKIEGNAFNGWNGDVGHGAYGSGTDSSMHGTITIKNSKVNYNGCVENYPLTGVYPDIAVGGCYGQGQGGYGDGLGMYYTEGDWVIEDTEIMHNTQDGLDLLYHTGQVGIISINRVRAEGNAGQQLKFGASSDINNSVVVGNCNFFFNNPIATQAGFSHCRAAGTAIQTAGWRSGHYISLVNSTIVGPNKTFIEVGTAASVSNAGGTGNTTGNAASIIYDSQFAVNQSQDTIWVRWAGNYNPNNGQIIARWNNYANKATLTGTWISDGNGIYHLTGLGAQTGGNYVLNDVVRAYVCDGTEKFVSRNNIFLGMEWWSASTKAIVPGTYSDLVYLDGWDGNGAGSCAATNPVVFDNKDGIAYNTKTSQCPNSNSVLCTNPLLTSVPPLTNYSDIYAYGERWNVMPQSGSPAIGSNSSTVGSTVLGSVVVPTLDIMKNTRLDNGKITWGAYDPNAVSSDTVAPTPAAFNMPATASSLDVAITSFTATDNVGVTGYIVTESSIQPASGAAGWSSIAPTSYTFSAPGSRTAYAWAKDAAGNVSNSLSKTVVITLQDNENPVISNFTMTSTASSLTVPITTLSASDNVGVTGYKLTESSTPPLATAAGWSASAPTSYTFASEGSKNLYAWAKDAAGNVSNGFGRTITITLSDTTLPIMTAFALPATATSLAVPVTSLTATDNKGVTGYLITESATKPAASATGWNASAPTGFAFSAAGNKTAYAWARDAAGNVSAGRSAAITITLPDTTPPAVSFSSPAAGATVSGSVAVMATASDNIGIAKVELYINGVLTKTDSASPFSFTWNTAMLANGGYTLMAKVYDAAGNSTASELKVTVYNPSSPRRYKRGDLNGDGKIDISDALLTLKRSVGLAPQTVNSQVVAAAADDGLNGDVAPLDSSGAPRGDGVIDIADALLILKNAVGTVTW